MQDFRVFILVGGALVLAPPEMCLRNGTKVARFLMGHEPSVGDITYFSQHLRLRVSDRKETFGANFVSYDGFTLIMFAS